MAHFEEKNIILPVVPSDFSGLDGTCRYCSDESAGQIREAVRALPLRAIHAMGTGDYHYTTLFWLERIYEPFTLVLFDNHPDDQKDAFGSGILSCGGWVERARALPFCKADIWIRRAEDLPDSLSELPVYISVDLDVLSEDYARTNWDQGTMTMDELYSMLSALARSRRIVGADICGGTTEDLNDLARRRIITALGGPTF